MNGYEREKKMPEKPIEDIIGMAMIILTPLILTSAISWNMNTEYKLLTTLILIAVEPIAILLVASILHMGKPRKKHKPTWIKELERRQRYKRQEP